MDELITIARPGRQSELPRPASERFKPLRLGIVNIWQYDHQEWRLENGWLLLRGDNGAGKTKVLELTLPFLFDGQMRPERLDPFGEKARTMKWNLLEDRAYAQRTGYSWIEFGRLNPEGEEEYVTVGACLRVTETMPRPEANFFVSHRRVGQEIHLPRAGEAQLSKDGLRRQVGELYETVQDYQQAVDQALFGFSLDRYRDLVNLLLQLRRPKLSGSLKPTGIVRLLTDSLPPIDEARITDLAGMFEQLDQYEERKLELARQVEAIDAYTRVQRTFVRRHLRKAAELLRRANTDVEADAEKLADAQARAQRSGQKVGQLVSQSESDKQKKDELEGRLTALRESPAMKAAERLQVALDRATDARGRLDDAQLALQERNDALATAEARAAAEEAEHQAAEPSYLVLLDDAAAAARAIGVLDLFQDGAEKLLEELEQVHPQLARLAGLRRGHLQELRRLQEKLTRAEASVSAQGRLRQRAEDERDDATQRTRAAERALAEARAKEAERVEAWAQDLAELKLAEEELPALIEAALMGGDGGSAAKDLLRALERRQQAELGELLAAAQAESRGLKAKLEELAEQRSQLLSVEDPAPPAPPTRAAREGRAGAPFYRLVDFRPELEPRERAGLEAALDASGILDAWLSPGGALLDAETFDTILQPGAAVSGRRLSELLLPVAEGEISEREARALLERIGLGPSDAQAWVAADGSFGIGPLAGRGRKEQAQYVGAAARRRYREQQLAELDRQQRQLEADLAAATTVEESLRAAQVRLGEEVSRFPAGIELAAAAKAAHAAALDLSQAERNLAAAAVGEKEARDAFSEISGERDERARALDLAAHLSDLDAFSRLIDDYADAVAGLRMGASRLREAKKRLQRELAERDLWKQKAELAKEQAESLERSWRKLNAAAEELRGSAEGRAAQDALERAGQLREQLSATERQMEDREKEIRQAYAAHAALEKEVEQLEAQHQGSVAEREKTAQDLIQMVLEGAMQLAVERGFDASGEWSMTRALELARQHIEPALANVSTTQESMDGSRNDLIGAFQTLGRELPDHSPAFEYKLDGRYPATSAVYSDRTIPIADLRDRLEEERGEQEQLWTRAETELIERYLLGEIADHLRERIRSAEEQVQAINRMMKGHRTSSGMYLSLSWRRSVEDERHLRALDNLMSDPSLLREEQRESLRQFFDSRLRGARDQSDNRSWREHLLEALDYRQWYRLQILKHKDGATSAFTDKEFSVGSGGEKAVSLHQPLFAAAAAYYDSAPKAAPRLIMLDEAFVGIDDATRGRCLDMVGEFDLDLVMTSAEEMGTHAEVRALGIYHMVRDHTVPGVLCEHWIWNGEELLEVPEA